MKRVVCVVLALIFVVGCASKAEKPKLEETKLEETELISELQYPFVIQDERGATILTTESSLYVTGVSYVEEDVQGDWIVVSVVARNTHPNSVMTVSPSDFMLVTDSEMTYSYHFKIGLCDRPFQPARIVPETQAGGEILYQILPGEKPTGMVIDTPDGIVRIAFQDT